MTNAHPNALSLAVVVAISSSIIVTQALADRRLQTKSFDIRGNEHVEFTHGEVMVQPTLGDDRQPVPKSFTTTYPDRTEIKAEHEVPSKGFTDILSGIEGGVSSVDLFETDNNDFARKYTKVLKVGNEGIFRFTHNLAEKTLVIEVRDGMTDQDSIEAIRNQSGDIQPLDPLTKIATPEQLAGLLKGANERAGNLGEADNYVALATVGVTEVEVNGRTFMRLVAAGDEPPGLQRLGQSLFINDEALLAAATSAYTQVHVLKDDLQQEALNDLLFYHKPVGYVVHVEDDTQVYPIPAGYPKLEVDQVSGEIIVFRGQKQNPTDIAFVESHYDLWNKFKDQSTQIKKDKVKSYQYVIRSRQMELLEEFAAELAAQNDAELNEDTLSKLRYYESLQQALTSATPDETDEFEFTTAHIRDASSVITPIWVQFQLIKNFNFKPVLKNLLINHNFVKNIENFLLHNAVKAFAVGEDTGFASKVMADIAEQMLEMVSTLEKLKARESELLETVKTSDPGADTTKARYAHAAAVLGITEWDDTRSLEEQAILLREKTHELHQSVTATGLSREKTLKETLAAIEGKLGIATYNENDLGGRSELILLHLRQQADQTDEVLREKLASVEGQLGLVPNKEETPEHRQKTIRKHLWTMFAGVILQERFQCQHQQKLEAQKNSILNFQHLIDQMPMIDKQVRDAVAKARAAFNTRLAAELVIDGWDDTQPLEKQARIIREKILEMDKPVAAEDDATVATTGQSREEAIKAKLAAIESIFGITLNNGKDLDAFYQHTQRHLQKKAEPNNVVIQNFLTDIESQLGLISDNAKDPEVRRQAIQQHLSQQQTEIDKQLLQQQSTSADADVQQEHLLQKLKTMNEQNERLQQQLKTITAQHELLLQRVQTTSEQQDTENSYTRAKKEVLATMLGIDLSDDTSPEIVTDLEFALHVKLHKLADLEKEIHHIRTTGHTGAEPIVLEKLTAVEKALKMDDLNSEEDLYYRRNAISEEIQTYITKARQEAEKEALKILGTVEKIFKIEVNKDDHKATRFGRVSEKLKNGDFSESMLDEMENSLWTEDISPAGKNSATRILKLLDRLAFHIHTPDVDARVPGQQREMLEAVEQELNIYTSENPSARERLKNYIAASARNLKVEFEKGVSLNDQRNVLRDKIQALRVNVGDFLDSEDFTRAANNEMAHQLNFDEYKVTVSLDEQKNLIKEKLREMDEGFCIAGRPTIYERITVIERELDRQMARLGPKPRYVLDRELARARQAIQKTESELAAAHRRLTTLRGKRILFAGHTTEIQDLSDEENRALNQAMKQVQIELDLTAGDKQTTEERLKDFRDFLCGCSRERRGEILNELKTKTGLVIQIKGDSGSVADADDFIAIATSADSLGQNENNEALGELLLTRKKYLQIMKFLEQHFIKSSELGNALIKESSAKKKLDRKEKEMIDPGDIDQTAKILHMNEMDRLGLILKQANDAVSKAQKALVDHHKAALDATEEAAGLKPDPTDTCEHRINALVEKQTQLGGHDGSGGKINQLLQEWADLRIKIEARKADIGSMEKVLKAAEEAVENNGGPYQLTPRQAKVLTDMDTFIQQHPLRQQALDAAVGLAESAVKNGKTIPCLATFDFNDEFATIRLQAVGDDLTFNQASRMVEVFKSLKTSIPLSPVEPAEDQPQNVIEQVQALADRARYEMTTGAQQYDDGIHGMGKRAIYFVEHEPEDLKGFSEYFASHSASGNKIMALLREGLISKIELENYMKAVRGVDGYQTVDEFEHFLGYKHDVHVPNFKKVVRMLSDKAVEAFMQSAFDPVALTATGPTGMKESVAGMKEYAAAVIANYVLDDIAFENGRRTAAFLSNVRDTLTPYAHAAGISESDLIETVHGTLMQAHAAAVERQLLDYWVKPSAFLVQAVTWYFSSYKPLLASHSTWQAAELSLSNMSFLYLLDLTNRGDYLHRMLTPFQHWLERYGVDLDRTGQYAYHSEIEQISELGGLAMPLGKAASSVILLRTGTMLFARQYNANPQMYRSISRLVPEIVKSMGSGQGVQIPLLHRVTPQKVKTLASATAGLMLGPVATFGTYAHGLLSGFTYAQTFGFALASSLTYDFFMNENRMLTQWLGGPLGRSLDKINRWLGVGETQDKYVKRTAVATPQRFSETDKDYTNRVKANGTLYGWTRHENYLQFRERRDRTMELYENGWEKYFRENVPKWSFSHAESIPYFYTLGAFYE
ncbi:hypothetical protein [Endozoicomonas sp. 8E]|uniref:hypothetical protein n=1 Tax=Endozoicomonas sp. 8E TaxID=3035692 RepID=UPI002938F24C|nr:hypothetical protein [Endozoicomonas sp. 8E]WOG29607.1 hypothetical protein P6910_08125 [Endozoicomonas sp. 8E]